MATLLNGVNEVLTRVGVIHGDSGQLTTLTDSARQKYIDIAVDVWNEAVEELYASTGKTLPKEQGESTITLSTGTRAYSLASDIVVLHFPLRDKTNSQFIYETTYDAILNNDIEEDDTGIPIWGCIRPTDGQLYVYPSPTAAENGNVYTYQYDKDVSLSAAADTFPFTDPVYRALIPCVAELWKRDNRGEFDGGIFRIHFGRAARLLTQVKPRTDYRNA